MGKYKKRTMDQSEGCGSANGDANGIEVPIAKRTRGNTRKFTENQEQMVEILELDIDCSEESVDVGAIDIDGTADEEHVISLPDDTDDDPVNAVSVVTIPQTGDIFKLDIDCYEEAFDYMPLEDLVNVGKTCKRLQQAAGYCFQQNYSSKTICMNENGDECYIYSDVKHFASYAKNLTIVNGEDFQVFSDNRSEFQRLKTATFFYIGFRDFDVSRAKEIPLGNLEDLRFSHCIKMDSDFYQIINQYPKLKRLSFVQCNGFWKWLEHKYPTLEYLMINYWQWNRLGYWRKGDSRIPAFLESHPNIRKFATGLNLLWMSQDKFKKANIKLDDLAIMMCINNIDQLKKVCDFLNELYERGFYRKLHLYYRLISAQEEVDQLASLNGLVKVHDQNDQNSNQSLDFSALRNLEELSLKRSKDAADLKMLPNHLTKLKRVHFVAASINDIMPFIRRSVEMQKIKVDDLKSGVHFNKTTGIINLLALNKEREQLPDAQKITMYVKEKIYLGTKWAMKGNDFGLIRLKRDTSFEWDHDFFEIKRSSLR